jgi:flagellar basal-body rod modification protein FlgD
MASSVSPLTSQPTTPTSNTSTSNSLSSAPSESMFLNLLVAQIQNQDPLNPTDSTQFVSQLAQFSELEQVIAIRGDTDSMAGEMKTAAAANTPTTPTTPSSGQDPTNGTTQT